MHKRTLPSDPYVFGHPDLVFGQGALQGSAFANMTGTLAQIAHLAAYSAEIMDGVLRLSEELSHRIDETTHRSELLSKTLLLTEQDVVKASQGPVVSGQSRVDRAPYTEKLSRLLTKNSNDGGVIDAYMDCAAPPQLSLFDADYGEGVSGALYSNPNFFHEEWVRAEELRQRQDRFAMKMERKAKKAKRKERREQKGLGKRPQRAELVEDKVSTLTEAPESNPAGVPYDDKNKDSEWVASDAPEAAPENYDGYQEGHHDNGTWNESGSWDEDETWKDESEASVAAASPPPAPAPAKAAPTKTTSPPAAPPTSRPPAPAASSKKTPVAAPPPPPPALAAPPKTTPPAGPKPAKPPIKPAAGPARGPAPPSPAPASAATPALPSTPDAGPSVEGEKPQQEPSTSPPTTQGTKAKFPEFTGLAASRRSSSKPPSVDGPENNVAKDSESANAQPSQSASKDADRVGENQTDDVGRETVRRSGPPSTVSTEPSNDVSDDKRRSIKAKFRKSAWTALAASRASQITSSEELEEKKSESGAPSARSTMVQDPDEESLSERESDNGSVHDSDAGSRSSDIQRASLAGLEGRSRRQSNKAFAADLNAILGQGPAPPPKKRSSTLMSESMRQTLAQIEAEDDDEVSDHEPEESDDEEKLLEGSLRRSSAGSIGSRSISNMEATTETTKRKSGAGLGDLGDWEEHVDPSTGNKYYANRVTNVGPFVEFSFAYVLLYVFRGVAYSPAFPFGTGIDVGRSTGNRIECCP